MNTFLPAGTYLENEKRFEFDFSQRLSTIKTFNDNHLSGTTVSPFRMIKTDDGFTLLIHNYDRYGDRSIRIESMGKDELVINDDDVSYKLVKVF